MTRRSYLLPPSLVCALVTFVWPAPVLARPNGFAVDCGGCHYGQLAGGGMAPPPSVTAITDSLRVEPGDQVAITVTVESNWTDASVAGFLVMTDVRGGVFVSSEEGTGNVGASEGETYDYAIGHTQARPLVNGKTTFATTWMAPTTPDSYEFAVFGVTSDDGDGIDDPDIAEESNEPVGRFKFKIGVGCDLVSYFVDDDRDGYGSEEVLSCDQPAGHVLVGGDCRDDDPTVNPGAQEQCSFVDENCDGDPMSPPTYYRDADGDGYGAINEIMVGCAPPEGYVAEQGDCETNNPAVHPGARELPANAIDDNCNGKIDEQPEASMTGGVDTTTPVATTPGVSPASADSVAVSSAAATPDPSSAVPTTADMSTSASTTPSASSPKTTGCSVGSRSDGSWTLLLACALLLHRRVRHITTSA